MQFDFVTAGRIVFGRGVAKTIPEITRSFGARALLVTGGHLRGLDFGMARFEVSGEPTLQTARDGVAVFRRERCDVVVGIGGGSVIDCAKAIAALGPNSGEPLDYLEVVGLGQALHNAPAPCIAAPTTAGTGSEVTRNAVLGVPEQRLKASLRSPQMLPRVAIVDPELALDLPPATTASTGMDALTQLIEPYVSARANPLTDLYCLEGIRRISRSLLRAYADGDIEARTDMAYASLLGGLALANAGLGVVHGFAAPIGGMFPAPHGAVCAALLAHGIRVNLRALQSLGALEAVQRYGTIANILTGSNDPNVLAPWILDLNAQLRIPSLSGYGITGEDVAEICQSAAKASSMKANPALLSQEELQMALMAAMS